MHPREIKNIFDLTLKQTSLGAGNVSNASESNEDRKKRSKRVGVFRAVTNYITEEIRKLPKYQNHTAVEIDLLSAFLDSINALYNHAGNCCERAALTYVNFLKQQIDTPVEIIFITQTPEKAHDFVLLGRKKESSLGDLSTWKGVTIVDTWPNATTPLKQFAEDKTPEVKDILVATMSTIKYIVSKARFDKPLTTEQWLQYANFLQDCKEIVTPEIIQESALERDFFIDAQDEFIKYQAVIDQEIAAFHSYAFKICHWRMPIDYSNAMFKPKSVNTSAMQASVPLPDQRPGSSAPGI